MRMKPFFTGLLSRIFSRQAATAQRPKRFAKIVAHTFCSTASANTFQSVAFDILFGAAGFQIQIYKPYALTMLNLKGFCSLSNGHLKKARPGVRFSIIEKTAMHRFSRFPQPLAPKAWPAAMNGTPAMQWFYGIAAHVAIRLGPPEAAAPNPTRVFGYGYKRAIE